jgi:hypothetical protein
MHVRRFTRDSRTGSEIASKKNAVLTRDIGGCTKLVGFVEVCWDVNIAAPSASVSLKILGQTVVSGEINGSTPCIRLQGSFGLGPPDPSGHADINVCLDVEGRKITAKGEACAFGDCTDIDVVLLQW